ERFFIGGGAGSTSAGRVGMWDGTQWLNAAESLPRFGVKRLRVLDDGTGARVYAFGEFKGVFSRNTEGGWDQIGDLFTDWTSDGLYFDLDGSGPMPETLVVGGEMRWSQGEPVNRVAWLDTTTGTWHPVGEGFDGFVN